MQKYRGHKTKYTFNDTSLSYEYGDAEDSVAFDVDYADIDVHYKISSTSKNPIWKFASFPFALLALFAVGKASLIAESADHIIAALLVALMWLIFGSLFVLKYKLSEVSLSMFDCVRGRLVVVHDGQEAEIIALLTQRVIPESVDMH